MERCIFLSMNKMGKEQLTQVVAKRYLTAKSRNQKSVILDEYCSNTGYHRKYALAKLKKCLDGKRSVVRKRLHLRTYGCDLDEPLLTLWKVAGKICAERLHPFLSDLIPKLEQLGYLQLNSDQRRLFCTMSISTMKRRITALRQKHQIKSKGISLTKPGFLLKSQIPIQTQCWDQCKPGFIELDLVAHCGNSASGDFIYTLQLVDIATTWTERKAVMGKGQRGVFTGIQQAQEKLPFALLGIDSDNGSEFINNQLYRYCQEQNIVFTRSRPYMSKDNAHIEQKNYTHVRKILGYDRFDTKQHLKLINDLYNNELRLYLNFFQPTLKMVKKVKIGAKYKRTYDKAQTPYQRVITSKKVSETRKQRLKTLYDSLDPLQLLQTIEHKVLQIVTLSKK